MKKDLKPEEQLWENFVEIVRVDANVPVLVNFLGSVEKFKKQFMEATRIPSDMLGKE